MWKRKGPALLWQNEKPFLLEKICKSLCGILVSTPVILDLGVGLDSGYKHQLLSCLVCLAGTQQKQGWPRQ